MRHLGLAKDLRGTWGPADRRTARGFYPANADTSEKPVVAKAPFAAKLPA